MITTITAILLWGIACSIEAIMDRMIEVFYLPLPTQGERLNKNWWSYNPLSPEKGLGIIRDGWHFLKAIHYGIITISVYLVTKIHINFWIFLLVVVIVRWMFFNLTLNYVRKKMTSDNNFKPI